MHQITGKGEVRAGALCPPLKYPIDTLERYCMPMENGVGRREFDLKRKKRGKRKS